MQPTTIDLFKRLVGKDETFASLSELQTWIRETHLIHIEPFFIEKGRYSYSIINERTMQTLVATNEFKTYDEALEDGCITAMQSKLSFSKILGGLIL